MKRLKNIFLATLMGLLVQQTAIAANKSAGPQPESLDRIIVIVNDTIITQSELNQAINMIKKQLAGSHVQIPPADIMRKQVLDQLINKKLQLQLAEHNGIQISDEDIDKAIAGIAKANHASTQQLYQKVRAQGMNISDYRKELHDELMIHEIQQQMVGSKIMITPEEVDEFMRSKSWQTFSAKEYHLEDILIALPEAPSPPQVAAARKHAEELLAKIRRGSVKFREAAAAESGDKNALQGGDLGWRKLPEIPSAFTQELASMKEHDVAGPIQAANGFHLLRLAGVRNIDKHGRAAPQKAQVQQLIFQRKFEEGLQNWITKLRSDSHINLHPEN